MALVQAIAVLPENKLCPRSETSVRQNVGVRTELLLRVPGEREQVGAHTPDRQVLFDPHGMHLSYGGNPYGPAGTGKIESVKVLGACLGRQVLVFNCDEGIDFQTMGRIFIGLVRCGAWGVSTSSTDFWKSR